MNFINFAFENMTTVSLIVAACFVYAASRAAAANTTKSGRKSFDEIDHDTRLDNVY